MTKVDIKWARLNEQETGGAHTSVFHANWNQATIMQISLNDKLNCQVQKTVFQLVFCFVFFLCTCFDLTFPVGENVPIVVSKLQCQNSVLYFVEKHCIAPDGCLDKTHCLSS